MLRWRWPVAGLTTYLALITLLACAPMAAWLAWQTASDVQRRDLQLQEQLQARSRAIAAAAEADLRGSADALLLLVASGWLDRLPHSADAAAAGGTAARTAIAAGPTLLRPGWQGLFIETAPDHPRLLVQGAAQASGLPSMSASTTSDTGGDRVALSVDAGSGRRLGAWIGNAHWQALLERAGAPPGGSTTLFDAQHRIVARSAHHASFVGQPLPADAVQGMAGKTAGIRRTTQQEGEPALTAWQRLPLAGWGVDVGVPSDPIRHTVLVEMAPSLAVAAACLLLGLLLSARVARKIAAPLAVLANDAAAQASQGTQPPLPAVPPVLSPVREIRALQDGLASASAQAADSARSLRHRAHEFETVFDASPVPLAVCLDRACRQWRHNRAMTELCRQSGGGKPQRLRDSVLLDPADWPLSLAASAGHAVALHEEAWQFAPSGVTRWLLVQATPLLDDTGHLRGAVESAVDVTALKEAQVQLAEAHGKLARAQQLIEAAQLAGGIGFFQYDTARQAFERTEGHAALFGEDLETSGAQATESLDGWLQQLRPDQATHLQAAIDALADGDGDSDGDGDGPRERVVQLQDVGRARRHLTVRMTASGGATDGPRTVSGVVVDTSDQHMAAATRERLLAVEQQAREAAERASADKDALLNLLGHELRNPLNALSVAAGVLKLGATPDALSREAQEVIERQGRELTRLVNQFLEMAGANSLNSPRTPNAPKPQRADTARAPRRAQQDRGNGHTRARTVHLVGDNADAAHSVQQALQQVGHNVHLSHGGVDGLAALLANPPEIAIVDLGLPDFNGAALARQARAAGYAGQMLAVCGDGGEDNRTNAFKSGFDDYMAKPLDLSRLRHWVADCI